VGPRGGVVVVIIVIGVELARGWLRFLAADA